ncbi:hypothetical protein FXO38_27139 [Capsicum annuum]|nr:hypothetical protein FXO38_27139 [Capsicum annuum]
MLMKKKKIKRDPWGCGSEGVNSYGHGIHGWTGGGGEGRGGDIDDEDLQNLDGEEMNRSHQSIEDEDLSVFDGKEDHYWEDDVEEEKGPMHDDSYTEEHYTAGSVKVIKVILEHNHELEPAMSHFCPSHRELSKIVKRSLVAHDITSLRPSKSIRILEVEAGGLEIMSCTPKDCRNYILQQRRLRTLSSNTTTLH